MRRLVNALPSIRVTYITATTLVWFHNSLRKLSRFPEKRCFNLAPKTQIFSLVLDFNLRLPSIGKIIRKHKHLIYNSPSLINIFPIGSIICAFRRTKNIKSKKSLAVSFVSNIARPIISGVALSAQPNVIYVKKF